MAGFVQMLWTLCLVFVASAVVLTVVVCLMHRGLLKVFLLGKHLRAHVVVLESDDWHMAGIPGTAVLEELRARGYQADGNLAKYAQESVEDLEALYAVLRKHKDSTGRPCCMTANVVMGNPDFDFIRRSNFREYRLLPV